MRENARVLVIDDDEIIGRSFDAVLSDKGYNITTAKDGEEGLQDVNSTEDFDVVFTDIVMPGVDGLTVAEKIKQRCPWTPVVVITGYGSKENEERASVLGVNGFVRKPLTPEMIENVTLKAINDREQLLNLKESANEEVELPSDNTRRTTLGFLKGVGMFLASPFIALAYIFVLPAFGMYQLSSIAYEAYRSKKADVSTPTTS